jgi:hypothetical protein
VNIDNLMALAELIKRADERHDGHLTILKFTTNCRICFVTSEENIAWDGSEIPDLKPDLSNITDSGVYGFIRRMPKGKTFTEAAQEALEADDGLGPNEVGRIISDIKRAL